MIIPDTECKVSTSRVPGLYVLTGSLREGKDARIHAQDFVANPDWWETKMNESETEESAQDTNKGGQAKRGSKKGEGERNECLLCTHGS